MNREITLKSIEELFERLHDKKVMKIDMPNNPTLHGKSVYIKGIANNDLNKAVIVSFLDGMAVSEEYPYSHFVLPLSYLEEV